MKILVANLGSTSFKYRVIEMPGEQQLGRGGIDRIGDETSHCFVEIGEHRDERSEHVANHAAAVGMCLDQLTGEGGCLDSVEEVAAIAFKTVHAGNLSGVRIVDEELLAKMEELVDVAPAHNPPYVRAMRQLRDAYPAIPLVAALETGFHDTIPDANRIYAVPLEWRDEHDVQRWGFHGASHRFVSGRIAELLGRNGLRVVTCHLGGSSSLCASLDGRSLATTMGMSPQGGVPQNNRVGDFDPFCLPYLMRRTGKSLDELLSEMSTNGGLLGISGLSGDLRDLEEATANGHERARLALDHFVGQIRHHLGGYMVLLGGLDAIVFSGGIGENSSAIRKAVTADLQWAGVRLDDAVNDDTRSTETRVSTLDSDVEVWVVPTNEEVVLARQSADALGRTN